MARAYTEIHADNKAPILPLKAATIGRQRIDRIGRKPPHSDEFT